MGTGEIGQNTVENLVKHVYQPKVKIANRSYEKAEKIAEKYSIPQIAFENFEEELKSTDISYRCNWRFTSDYSPETFSKRKRNIGDRPFYSK